MNDIGASSERQSGGRRAWVAAGIVAVVIVALALVAFLLLGQREDADYPAGSPEAAFQDFMRAWQADDVDLAWASLSAQAQERTTLDRFRSANLRRREDVHRVWIDDVFVDGERAVLHLSVESLTDDGILGPGRERASARMTLVREGGDWKVDSPTVVYYW